MDFFSNLFKIFIMHFNESIGVIPLLIYPHDSVKNDENIMRPIKYHPIWFLDSQEESKSESIDLIYEGKVYFARKFKIFLEAKNSIVKREEPAFNLVVLILVFLKNMNLFGKNYLNIVTEIIIKNFENLLQNIIISEIQQLEVIKTSKTKLITEGDLAKEKIKILLNDICRDYFSLIYYYQKINSINLERSKMNLI
ncbi:MAG: hypothetical protein ACFFCI_10030 [Promethearchaeota archaeon]